MNPSRKRAVILGGAVAAVVALFVAATIFVGGGKHKQNVIAGTGQSPTAEPIAITCIGGSEKTALMDDPDVKRILHDKYGLTVTFVPMGSYDQVSLSDDELKSRSADCLWPSSVSAQFVFESTHKTSAYKGYRAETVLQSPEVVYAGPNGTDALIKAGIVQQRDNNHYYIVDFKKLLEFVKKGVSWNELGSTNLAGPVVLASTDPAKSNSGFTLYQLMLTMLSTPNVYQAPSVDQARSSLGDIRKLYDSQGLQARSSDSGFDQWLLQGGEAHAPLYAGYESQIIQKVVQYQGNTQVKDLLSQSVRILYPEPTIYSDHPVLTLNSNAGRFIDAMKDHDIQTIAWKTYGFRSGVEIGLNNVADFPQLPLAQQLKTTSPPNAAVTQLLINCIRTNVCS